MQVEDPAPSGGAEERRLRRLERSLARLRREGNAARQIPSWRGDDALMVDQGAILCLDAPSFF
jgi:hypothetical protein